MDSNARQMCDTYKVLNVYVATDSPRVMDALRQSNGTIHWMWLENFQTGRQQLDVPVTTSGVCAFVVCVI